MSEAEEKAPAVTRWDTANAATREAAKWTVLTLGLLAAAIFGAAPAARGLTFSWSDPDDAKQLWLAIGFGVIGVSAMIGLILRVGKTLLPVLASLNDVSEKTRKIYDDAQDTRLPVGTTSVAQLVQQIKATRAAIVISRKQTPANAAGRAAVQADIDEAKKNLDNLNSWAADIVQTEIYNRVRDSFLPKGPSWLWALVGMAAIGAIGFTFALAKPADPEDKDGAGGASTPQVGFLLPGSDEDASKRLWSNLDLEDCEVNGQVPVLVISKSDQVSTVRTIPTISASGKSTCDVWEFDVIPESAQLATAAEPRKFEILYSPSPTPPPAAP